MFDSIDDVIGRLAEQRYITSRAIGTVVYLASRACEFSHRNYSAFGGRFARVFVGLGEGWLAEPGSNPTADDVADHLAEISATEKFIVPESIYEEVFAVSERLGVGLV